jgi:mRNA interferase MazF
MLSDKSFHQGGL